MNLNHVRVFILPLCDFSLEESHNLSLDELNSLWQQERITKYSLEHFLQDINDDTLGQAHGYVRHP